MAETAFQIQYRQEFIAGFEQRQSLLRNACTTEAVIKGNQATFLVADSGAATAVTRGVNGLIPSRADNLTQPVATLAEWHDLVKKSGFNVFASQGDQRRIMQETSMGVVNRKIDDTILTILDTTTVTTGSTAVASLDLVMHAATILGNNDVDITDGNVTYVISPGFHAYLVQTKEFSSMDFSKIQPMNGQRFSYNWLGFNFIVHPNLSGKGTSSEKCFAFHKSAVGHAVDTAGIASIAGYDEEQDYSYARTTVYQGAVLLQGDGVVEILHDGSGFAAA